MEYRGLLAGLGNPGRQYAGTRHNCGYMLVERLLEEAGTAGNAEQLSGKKFNCELWRVAMPRLEGEWLCAMPLTFMNESGKSIQPLLRWHHLEPRQLVVAHDELDIPVGQIRFKFGGGLAGHNGLRSIAACIGTQDFYRLRIGIGKPETREEIIGWVLDRPTPADRQKLDQTLAAALETFLIFTNEGLHEASVYARHA